MKLFTTFLGLLLTVQVFAQLNILLETVTTSVTDPVDITHAGDDRLFIVERSGRIQIVDGNGNLLSTPFLDIDDRVRNTTGNSEQGLLGLTFHPDYNNNGYLFVHYTNNDGDSRISRFTVNSGNANLADANTEKIILTIEQPFPNHNGGDLAFGPDGYLYIGMGDGGSGNDPGNRAQNPLSYHGKMLRIDVDNGAAYGIPADNPFNGVFGTLNEIWSLGWRNPWRFSFDRLTGDMWVGDVGQNAREEIDFEPAGSPGGLNYGWRCYEGDNPHITNGCGDIGEYTFPIIDYQHANGPHCSVTGGFVYRGDRYRSLYGKYIYADFCSGQVWALTRDSSGMTTNESIGVFSNYGISSFGEGADGELYMASLSRDAVYRIYNENCANLNVDFTVTKETCKGDNDGAIELHIQSAVSYQVNWSGGAQTETITNLTEGTYEVTVTDALDCSRVLQIYVDNLSVDELGITADRSGDLCTGDTVRLTANDVPDGYSYQWYNGTQKLAGETDSQYVATTEGRYYVALENGPCPVFNNSNWIDVRVSDQPAAPALSPISFEPFCGDTSYLLTIQPAPDSFTIQWYNGISPIDGANGTELTVDTTGNYYAVYEGVCPSLNSNWATVLIDPIPEVPMIEQNGNTLSTESGFTTYQWLLNGDTIPGATNASYTLSETGDYSVIVATAAGCSNQSVALTVTIVGVQNSIEGLNWELEPNPASRFLQVRFTNVHRADQLSLEVVDAKGRVLQSRAVYPSKDQKIVLDVDGLSAGIYFVRVRAANQSAVKRFVKVE